MLKRARATKYTLKDLIGSDVLQRIQTEIKESKAKAKARDRLLDDETSMSSDQWETRTLIPSPQTSAAPEEQKGASWDPSHRTSAAHKQNHIKN